MNNQLNRVIIFGIIATEFVFLMNINDPLKVLAFTVLGLYAIYKLFTLERIKALDKIVGEEFLKQIIKIERVEMDDIEE